MSAPAATGRAPVAVAAGLLLAVLAGCGDERGALVTFTLSADEMTALRQQAGPGGQVRGEVFVARGAAGALRREPNLGDAGPTDSWTFDDDDLPGGFTVQVTDADSDLVTVALAVWAEPADVDDTWIPTSGAYFVARQVNPSGGLRAYAAPLALVPTGTQRRLDCPASIDPGPDGGTLWWGARRSGPAACIGWQDGDAPVSIVSDPVADPDCDGVPEATDAEACLRVGQHQCWSNVPDDPAEDADGDGFVADVAGGPSVALIDGACEACLDVGGCECAPADTEFAIPRAVDVCTEDVCEVPSEPIKRRCVSSPLNGEPCVAGFLNCGEACQAEGVAQVLGDCGQQPLELDCGERACDPRATDGVSWACERHSDGLVACPWRGKLAGLIDGLNNEATCTGARVWGAEGLGLKLLGQLVGAVPGGALAPIGPLDAAVCKTLILQALEAPELGERHVIVEVTSDFGIAATTYVVPIRIEAAAIDGNACEPNDVEDDACAHL